MLQLRRGGGPHTPRAPHGGMRLRGGVRLLARKYGIEVEEERGTEEAGRHEARQAIFMRQRGLRPLPPSYDPAEGITGEDENGEEDLRALRETFSHFGVGISARRPRGLQALPEAACLPGKGPPGADSGLRRAVPGNGGGGNGQIRQLR